MSLQSELYHSSVNKRSNSQIWLVKLPQSQFACFLYESARWYPSKCCQNRWVKARNQGRILIWPLNNEVKPIKSTEINCNYWDSFPILQIYFIISTGPLLVQVQKSNLGSPRQAFQLAYLRQRGAVVSSMSLFEGPKNLDSTAFVILENFSRQHSLAVHLVYLFLWHPHSRGW